MAQEPIIAPAEFEVSVHADAPGVERPAPPAERQQVADDLFAQAATALLGLQAGVAAGGLIIDNVTEKKTPPEAPPRLPPEKK